MSRLRSPRPIWAFWAWAAVGCAIVFGALSFLLIGLVVLGLASIVAAVMATYPEARTSAFGLLSGAGLPLLYVAYAQRDGPGTTCWHTATANGCDQHLDPVPWLAFGVALILLGVLFGCAVHRRQAVRHRTT